MDTTFADWMAWTSTDGMDSGDASCISGSQFKTLAMCGPHTYVAPMICRDPQTLPSFGSAVDNRLHVSSHHNTNTSRPGKAMTWTIRTDPLFFINFGSVGPWLSTLLQMVGGCVQPPDD